ncbi:MAG: polyprenyl synthetase family protein [Bdellovibrionota bacterium]
MIPSIAVATAFERSRPHVNALSSYQFEVEPPDASVVDKVCRSLWDRRGKRLRSHLVFWFGEMAGVEASRLSLYAWAAEAVHTATLLHDDVIDVATVRRGEPSANVLFGNTLPVLSGDYLLSDAVQRIAEKGEPRLLAGLCSALKQLVCGESLQYELRFTIPKSDRIYWRIAELKTGALLKWAALAGPELAQSPWKTSLGSFMTSFGQLFQFSDDLLDVLGAEDKEAWVDLKEGKLNYVTWQLLSREPDLVSYLTQKFAQKQVNDEVVRQVERRVSKPFLKEVRQRLENLADRAIESLCDLPHGNVRSAAEGLVKLCVDRTR